MTRRVRIGELRELLNEWDFIGVREFSVYDDEYDCLVSPLLTRLVGGADADEVASYLRGEIRDHFGMDAEQVDVERFVGRVVAWWAGDAVRDA